MRGMEKSIKYILSIMTALFFVCCVAVDVFASEETDMDKAEVKFKQAVADENKIKVYIRGVDALEGVSYQIGNIPVDALEVYKIDEDRSPVRTLIMLDNSISIPSASHGKITELLNGIVDAHTGKEVFRLATFSDKITYLSDTYSDDYTVLKNVIASITYKDQETYLTDVLYDLIDDLNKDGYMGYTRVIIVSDGVDNKQLGVTREELNSKLKETPYPIYTVGTLTQKNHEQLENMFALSRLSGSAYFVLEETDTSAIVSEFSKDAQMTVIEAQIPDDAKAGGNQSSKLTLPDGVQLVFNVQMPFKIKDKDEQQMSPPEPEPLSEELTQEDEEAESGFSILLAAGILGGILLLAVIMLVVLLMRKKNKPVERGTSSDTEIINDTETQRIDDAENGGILPPSGQQSKSRYRVILTDKSDMSRTYQCELKNSINLGKIDVNDIVVNVGTVSKRHCMITNKNGRFFIQDLNSTNGTFVNGERISFDTEIFSGTTIRMGRAELIIKFEQV